MFGIMASLVFVVYSFAANIHRYPGLAQTNLSFRRGWAVEGAECNRDV